MANSTDSQVTTAGIGRPLTLRSLQGVCKTPSDLYSSQCVRRLGELCPPVLYGLGFFFFFNSPIALFWEERSISPPFRTQDTIERSLAMETNSLLAKSNNACAILVFVWPRGKFVQPHPPVLP